MKHKRKLLWLSLVALLFIVFTTACGNKETIFLKMDNTTATLNKKVEAKFTFKTNKGNKYTVTDVKTGQKLGTKKADSGNEELTLFDVGKYKLTVYFNGDKKSKIITVKPLRIKASELTGESSSSKNKSESKSKAMNFGQGDMVGNGDMVANRDITSYPDQGTVITSDGQQIDAALNTVKGYKENFGGDIAKGVTKEGDIMAPVEKLNNVSDIKSLRLKFDGSYDTDNYEDDNSQHDYDITLNLN